MKKILAIILLAALSTVGAGAEGLKPAIESYVRSTDAEIGVALIIDSRDTVTVSDGRPYPMNSVMKLYQAMAVADVLQHSVCRFDSTVFVKRSDLHPATYSPMRDDFAGKDMFEISVADLLRYSLQQSDNNACDLLFDRIAGMGRTEAYVRSLGIGDFSIAATERDMYADHDAVMLNHSSPLAAAELINRLFTTPLYESSCQDFLKETLRTCRTGENRLAKPFLPTNVVIGHKTGTGFDSPEGLPQGINDVGFVNLPNGRNFSIAVFIRRFGKSMAVTEKMIADISAIVFRELTR